MKPYFSPSCNRSCLKMAHRLDRFPKMFKKQTRWSKDNDLLATDNSRYFDQPPPMIVNYFDIFVGTATHWEDKVASISKEGVKPGNTLVSQLQLPVPSLPQTMQSCSCMKISYLLRVIYSISVHGDLWESRLWAMFLENCHLLLTWASICGAWKCLGLSYGSSIVEMKLAVFEIRRHK